MQVPCSLDFGPNCGFVVCESHVFEERILKMSAGICGSGSEGNDILVEPWRLGLHRELEAWTRTWLSQMQHARYR